MSAKVWKQKLTVKEGLIAYWVEHVTDKVYLDLGKKDRAIRLLNLKDGDKVELTLRKVKP